MWGSFLFDLSLSRSDTWIQALARKNLSSLPPTPTRKSLDDCYVNISKSFVYLKSLNGSSLLEIMYKSTYLCTAHITHSFMAVYNSSTG